MTSEILRFVRGTCWKDGSIGGCRLFTLTARKQCSRSRNGPTTKRVVPARSKKIHLSISLADAECAMCVLSVPISICSIALMANATVLWRSRDLDGYSLELDCQAMIAVAIGTDFRQPCRKLTINVALHSHHPQAVFIGRMGRTSEALRMIGVKYLSIRKLNCSRSTEL
jgi:hypothetical protein